METDIIDDEMSIEGKLLVVISSLFFIVCFSTFVVKTLKSQLKS